MGRGYKQAALRVAIFRVTAETQSCQCIGAFVYMKYICIFQGVFNNTRYISGQLLGFQVAPRILASQE